MVSVKVKTGDPVYDEIVDFLQREAEVLDNGEFREWLSMMAKENFYYVMPVRTNRERVHGEGFLRDMFFFEENYASMVKRVERLETEFAWAEDPPSRTRRFIDNVRVEQFPDNTFKVKSYLLMMRNRGNEPQYQMITCVRNDTLVRGAEGLKLTSREILVDLPSLGTDNLSIFL